MTELELQKAKGNALAQHFKKGAAHHEKKAAHHEKMAKAHHGAADHHESMMGKAEDAMHAHHKVKAAYHKTQAGHHETAAKLHKAHAEHHHAMGKAMEVSGIDQKNKPSSEVKAAFTEIGVDLDALEVTKVDPTPAVADPAAATATTTTETSAVDPAKTSTGDPNMSDVTKTATSAEPNATDLDVAKQLNDGLQEALKNALKENLASPEFRKQVQEQIANVLLQELGKKTLAPTAVKTFAVPRTNSAETIRSGATPKVESTGVDAEFAHLVSMD